MDENSGKNRGIANLKPFKPGESGNPDGRPKGQKNYATLRAEAIIAVGKANGKTPEEIEIMLHQKGIAEALKGDFRFYKDDQDRTHGQATQKHEIGGDGIGIVLVKFINSPENGKDDTDTRRIQAPIQ